MSLTSRQPRTCQNAGVVSFYVSGTTDQLLARQFSPARTIELVQNGLSFNELIVLQASLDLPLEALVPKLGISKATLHRRKAAGKLDPAESDRVVRLARLFGKAVEVMESQVNARKWLMAPQVGLGGAIPLDYAETEIGAREVEDLLGRIEHGVYS
jgi:putative toxin-antitoxin system antitoxin component (TIGR02293 family)